MRNLHDHLATYAAYHRDRRNIATHFVGIPMIVAGVFTFMARPAVELESYPALGLSPALGLFGFAVAFYLLLDLRFGTAMAAFTAPALWLGTWLSGESTGFWLGAASILFVGGWVIQFIGHAFEGKKPAFVDDLVGLLIGPLFLVAEAAFAMGLRRELCEGIEAKVGPTYIRRSGEAAAAAPSLAPASSPS